MSQPPSAYAARPLFEPIADLLARFDSPALPDVAQLNRLLAEVSPAAASCAGQPIRFAAPTSADAYEERVFASGDVPTRAGDWHDFFNALAWCVWPCAKAACNALHVRARQARVAAGPAGRGGQRDALTQFDECGIVVASATAEVPRLLAEHAWEEVFWRRRAQLRATTRFLVFGHATWDQLRQPFRGLCAKAIFRTVEPQWLTLPPSERQADIDRWLAGYLEANVRTPRDLSPLPVLGVPGVTAENEAADYYRDAQQFRPRR